MAEKIIWPDFLDIPLRDDYNYSPTDRRAKADMEIGSRYRVMFDTDETTLNCHFALKLSQLAFFEAFEKHILRQGSKWFDMPISTAGVIQNHSVRFKERPRMSDFRGGYAFVAMTLDVAERKTASLDEVLIAMEIGLDTKYLDRIDRIVNVEYQNIMPYPPLPIVCKNGNRFEYTRLPCRQAW